MANRERIRTFQAGDVVGTTFALWIKFLIPFTILGAVLNAPLIVMQRLIVFEGEWTGILVFLGASIVVGQLFTATLVFAIYSHMRGDRVGIGACISRGFSSLFPVVGVALITGLLILAGCFLLIPGIILAMMWWVVVPAAVVEKLGVGAAMKRSAELTAGHRGAVFLAIILLVVLIGVFGGLVGFVIAMFGASETVISWAGDISGVIFGSLGAIAPAVGYYHLRMAKEGLETGDLAAVFD